MARPVQRACSMLLSAAIDALAAFAACPDCDPARAARAAIEADPASASYLLYSAMPFGVFAGVAALLHRIGRPPRRGSEER